MRLIDADAMLETLKRKYPQWYTRKPKDSWMHYVCLVYYWAVREAPTIDAVPVVRCKDCKWKADTIGESWCDFHEFTILSDDDYCSHGERKDDE